MSTIDVSPSEVIHYFEHRLGKELPPPSTSGEIMVCCPIHHDSTPSMAINPEKALWNCFAGCGGGDIFDFEQILHDCEFAEAKQDVLAIIRPEEHSSPSEPKKPNCEPPISSAGQHEIKYIYHDEQGDPIYAIVRRTFADGKKTFSVGYKDKQGNTVWEKPSREVLYRLPEVIACQSVFVVEGEKCVEAVRTVLLASQLELQIAVTCNPFGANHWKPEFSEALRGKDVFIFPDNDKPGREHAAKVAKSCWGIAARIKMVEVPGTAEGSDIADFLSKDAQAAAQQLIALLTKANDWYPDDFLRPDVICLADVQAEQVEWIWKPYIPKGKLTVAEGDPAAGKTFLALAISAILSKGQQFPMGDEHTQPPANVVYLTAEDGLADTIRPRFDILGGDPKRFFAVQGALKGQPGKEKRQGITLSDVEMLERLLKALKPALVVVDPLQAYLGSGVDLHRANEVRPVLAEISKLAEHHGCAVLILRHLSKASQTRGLYRGLGSIDIAAAARSVLLVGSDPDDPGNRAFVPIKASVAKLGPAMGFRIEENGFAWTGISTLTKEDLLASSENGSALDDAVDFLSDALAGGAKLSKELGDMAQAAEISEKTLKRAKHKLGVIAYQSGSQWFCKLPNSSEGQNQGSGGHT